MIDLQRVLLNLGLVSSVGRPSPLWTFPSEVTGHTGGGLAPGVLLGIPDPSLASLPQNSDSNPNSNADTDVSTVDGLLSLLESSGDSCTVNPYPSPPIPVDPFEPWDPAKATMYRYRQQQSVNLGAWFVQEEWMNPALFACAANARQAELDVASGWGGTEGARQVLERHWDEWIGEADFKWLRGVGINTVRLPIGYWSLGPSFCAGTPFEPVADVYTNAWPRVLRAINTAAKYGLGVLVDLHGAPGSQNGQAHSGVSDGQQGLFDNPANVQRTMDVLTFLTQQLAKVNNVVGIEILNEPSDVDALTGFYTSALETLRGLSPEAAAFPFYINDAFNMAKYGDFIAARTDFVVLDHHSYFVFGDADAQRTPVGSLDSTLAPGQGSLSQDMLGVAARGRSNIVIDEFSCALTQDALAASADPTGDRRAFCTGQMEAYANATAGYSFWSYKTENCDDDPNWCFRSAVGVTLPPTFYSYPSSVVQSYNASLLAFGPAISAGLDTQLLSVGMAASTGLGLPPAGIAQLDDMLASTEYDDVPMDTPGDRMTTTVDRLPLAASPQAAFEMSTAPQVARLDRDHPASRRSTPAHTYPYIESRQRSHRFTATRSRKSLRSSQSLRKIKTADIVDRPVALARRCDPTARGHGDGFKAAKAFAAFDGSRLGFSGQFMQDALTAMNGAVAQEDEQAYREAFMQGLAAGELEVIRSLAQGQNS